MLDPQRHFEDSINRAADRYVDGLQRAGLQPNEKLTRAMSERAAHAAREDYQRQANQQFEGNVGRILSDYRARDRQIKRDGARMAWMTCPLAVLLFSGCAWFNFQHGDKGMGLIYVVGALVFLLMLVLAHRRGRQ